jgi:hypothetical protein
MQHYTFEFDKTEVKKSFVIFTILGKFYYSLSDSINLLKRMHRSSKQITAYI